ncbi:MAG: monoheme cytochrome c [Rhodobacteraceae bacterium HLUCCA12]|nr:MAG: monoheme cytochrome c [Rhodobacteraceae bacterium HLUCCA12]
MGALAIRDGQVLSGGFDTRSILWDLDTGAARQIQHFHEGNVTAVAFLPGGMLATGGQDGRIALWQGAVERPTFATPDTNAPIVALSLAPDDATLAAGFGDGRIARMSLDDHSVQDHQAHQGQLTGLAYLPDGHLASVGDDLRLSIWDRASQLAARAGLAARPNGLAVTEGRLAVVFADGALRLYAADGSQLPQRFLTDRPLVAVAAGTGAVAAAAIDGTVWVLEDQDLSERFTVSAGADPVWALALDRDTLLGAGNDGTIRRWSARDGERQGQSATQASGDHDDGSRGARVWRACAVCHSLSPGDNSRAGPTLHGVLGRRIASAPGYAYSQALRSMDIVWTRETVSALFEHGPEVYTPGSRMPDQRISDPRDRAALIDFLERASR